MYKLIDSQIENMLIFKAFRNLKKRNLEKSSIFDVRIFLKIDTLKQLYIENVT